MRHIHLYIRDFLLFLKDPGQEPKKAPTPGIRFWLALANHLGIALMFSLPLVYLINRYMVRLRHDEAVLGLASSPVLQIIAMVVLAPLLEELLFRYPLKFFTPKYLKLAVYLSSVIFGVVHTTNYENSEPLFYLLTPIIISSQSIGGFLLAYLRMRNGVWWSILAHALFNATVWLISFLLFHDKVVLRDRGEHYQLEVKEFTFREGEEERVLDRKEGNTYAINWKQATLQSLVDSLSSEEMVADQVIIDVDFKTEKGVSADSVLTLLRKKFRIE